MNRHSLTYLELNPRDTEREPHPVLIWIGAAFALAALWIVCVFLFSL